MEPLKAVGLVTPVLNADLRGQKPMRRFRSPRGPALRAGQFSAAALWQAPCGKEMKGMRNRALATVPPQKTPSEAPHRLLLADPRRTNRLSALLSAFLSVSKYRAVKLLESPGRAGGFTNVITPAAIPVFPALVCLYGRGASTSTCRPRRSADTSVRRCCSNCCWFRR